jgi:hypothetical protein
MPQRSNQVGNLPAEPMLARVSAVLRGQGNAGILKFRFFVPKAGYSLRAELGRR